MMAYKGAVEEEERLLEGTCALVLISSNCAY
jgi:hypothetical protein